MIANVVVSAFFHRDKARDRDALRMAYVAKVDSWLGTQRPTRDATVALELQSIAESLAAGEAHVPAFHWELEFPEVFTRSNSGFDAFIGNPPFLGGNQISTNFGMPYFAWLSTRYPPAGGVCAGAPTEYMRRVRRANPCLQVILFTLDDSSRGRFHFPTD